MQYPQFDEGLPVVVALQEGYPGCYLLMGEDIERRPQLGLLYRAVG